MSRNDRFALPLSLDPRHAYWSKITKPVDLATMTTRITAQEYLTPDMFLEDIKLIQIVSARQPRWWGWGPALPWPCRDCAGVTCAKDSSQQLFCESDYMSGTVICFGLIMNHGLHRYLMPMTRMTAVHVVMAFDEY